MGEVVIRPGTYLMTAGVSVPSNSTLRCSPGVRFKKAADFSSFFISAGASTRVLTTDVKLIGCGTVLDNNGFGHETPFPLFHGGITLAFTRRWTISGFIFDCTTGVSSLAIQTHGTHELTIEDIVTKCGTNTNGRAVIQLQADTKNVVLRNLTTQSSSEDSLAFNSNDWPTQSVTAGDIENVIIENWTDLPSETGTNGGFALRLYPGSWTTWSNGMAIYLGDSVVSSGKIYKVVGKSSGTWTERTSTVAPSATLGNDLAGADGIVWRYLCDGTFTTANVRNITVRNCVFSGLHAIQTTVWSDDITNPYARSVYPGTENTAEVTGVVIESCKWSPTAGISNGFLSAVDHFGSIVVRNVDFTVADNDHVVFYPQNNTQLVGNGNLLKFENCKLKQTAGNFIGTQVGGSIKTLSFVDCILEGVHDLTNGSFIWSRGMDCISKLKFSGCTIRGVHELFYSEAGSTCDITVAACDISGHERLYYGAHDNTVTRVRITDTNLGEAVSGYQFLTTSALASVRVWINGVSGGGTIAGDGKTEIVFADVPIETGYVKLVAGSLCRNNTGAWVECDGTTFGAIRN